MVKALEGAVMTLTMSATEREAFLAGLHVGVLSVADEAGRAPLAIPVWYLYEPGGDIAFITGRDSPKMDLVRKASRVSLVAQDEELPYRYVSVEGRWWGSRTRSRRRTVERWPSATSAPTTPDGT
jgi:general stress protein 26